MNILIIYASRRGTTRKMVQRVQQELEKLSLEITVQKAATTTLEDLREAQIIILGSSTWADGDLHEDFDKLEREMRDMDLSGKGGAVLGSGNSRFPYYCEAVDILETRLKHCNTTLLLPSLKCDVMEKRITEETEAWVTQLYDKVKDFIHL